MASMPNQNGNRQNPCWWHFDAYSVSRVTLSAFFENISMMTFSSHLTEKSYWSLKNKMTMKIDKKNHHHFLHYFLIFLIFGLFWAIFLPPRSLGYPNFLAMELDLSQEPLRCQPASKNCFMTTFFCVNSAKTLIWPFSYFHIFRFLGGL